ncbi:hypothetical protein IFM89_032230 [Coptis chinensis]|uniref:SAM domain-containing protein n=1 Tax=Coptis chinensis TaxID=261450 RepID=A0A835HYF0_9MAGN|nr:hypothetical protein IFM89_032230 [Coptis chinensis]
MAELQPTEVIPINNGGGGGSSENIGLVGSKRQRRPSVRLGDIGDQPATLSYDSYVSRRSNKHHQWGGGPDNSSRPLTNLVVGHDETLEMDDTNKNDNLDLSGTAIRKAKRGGGGGTKRVRSSWVSNKLEDGNISGGEEGGDVEGFRDFDPDEGSQSPLKEHSPIHSLENPDIGQRRGISRARVSESREQEHEGVEMDGPSDTDGREWNNGGGSERGRFWTLEDSVRMWLHGLGLGRYAPVFEMHEVDEEVLPQLTLEDLKDMGINAIGSRRKLYSAIQKLAKGFSLVIGRSDSFLWWYAALREMVEAKFISSFQVTLCSDRGLGIWDSMLSKMRAHLGSGGRMGRGAFNFCIGFGALPRTEVGKVSSASLGNIIVFLYHSKIRGLDCNVLNAGLLDIMAGATSAFYHSRIIVVHLLSASITVLSLLYAKLLCPYHPMMWAFFLNS